MAAMASVSMRYQAFLSWHQPENKKVKMADDEVAWCMSLAVKMTFKIPIAFCSAVVRLRR